MLPAYYDAMFQSLPGPRGDAVTTRDLAVHLIIYNAINNKFDASENGMRIEKASMYRFQMRFRSRIGELNEANNTAIPADSY